MGYKLEQYSDTFLVGCLLDNRQLLADDTCMAKRRTKQPTFSQQLREHIDGCGLTRYEIAKQASVEQSALSRFMSGERGLSTATLDRLAKLLDLELVMHGPKCKEKQV